MCSAYLGAALINFSASCAALTWEWRLLIFPLHVRRLINFSAPCAALIWGRRLLTFPLHVRRLIEGGAYFGAALIWVNTVTRKQNLLMYTNETILSQKDSVVRSAATRVRLSLPTKSYNRTVPKISYVLQILFFSMHHSIVSCKEE